MWIETMLFLSLIGLAFLLNPSPIKCGWISEWRFRNAESLIINELHIPQSEIPISKSLNPSPIKGGIIFLKLFFYQILLKMTYLVQLLDPRAQALLDALVHMSMVQLTPVADASEPMSPKTKRLAEIADSLREVKAHRKGTLPLQTLTDFLKELD
jgi:hypothetical protein